jgi:competence protein ComEA
MKKILSAGFAAFLILFAGLANAAVDLNTATAADLEKVKGIGPVKAKTIIDYRAKNGPFKSVDDLKSIKGFGAKTLDKLRPELSVGGAPAAPAAPVTPTAAIKK